MQSVDNKALSALMRRVATASQPKVPCGSGRMHAVMGLRVNMSEAAGNWLGVQHAVELRNTGQYGRRYVWLTPTPSTYVDGKALSRRIRVR